MSMSCRAGECARILTLAASLAVSALVASAEEGSSLPHSVCVVHDAGLSEVEVNVLRAFSECVRVRSGLAPMVVTEAEARQVSDAERSRVRLVVLAGVAGRGEGSGGPLAGSVGAVPEKAEGFLLRSGSNRGRGAELLPRAEYCAEVVGRDARGLLYGLGKLLRIAEYGPGTVSIPEMVCAESPATAQRVAYFACHFNNFYESAPVDEVLDYVTELAFWGFNGIWTWFDMNWYPEGFWDDPGSKGAALLDRIRRINERARSLGLDVGFIGCANEGFKNQPPRELLADPSERRGGFYPDTTICPSKPGGLDLILANRRKILELIGPIDVYITWAFDQGGCGCARCKPWASTYMKMNPAIAAEVRRLNPEAKVLVSTWYFTDDEMGLIGSALGEGATWFDGVLTETKWAGRFQLPEPYTRVVFPEISMEGSLLTGYGASGANPMPSKCVEQAREASRHGYGAALYSEGAYEDLNKVVWVRTLWDPARTADDTVRDYTGFYFGPSQADDWTRLILGLEKTWPPEQLATQDAAVVRGLSETADRLVRQLPEVAAARMRAQYFRDRAQMDWGFVRVGPDADLIRQVKTVFTEAGYSRDLGALRQQAAALRERVAARAADLRELYRLHWDYLCRAHLDRSTALIATPPAFVGQRDWNLLEGALDGALAQPDDEAMRVTILRSFKEWFWHNNVDIAFALL